MFTSDDTVAIVKAVNSGFARLSHEVFQNMQKLNAHSKDQYQLLQEMLKETINGFNERIYTLSEAQFKQKQSCQINCRQRTIDEVAQALATEENLPLARALSDNIQKMKRELEAFEVPSLITGSTSLFRTLRILIILL